MNLSEKFKQYAEEEETVVTSSSDTLPPSDSISLDDEANAKPNSFLWDVTSDIVSSVKDWGKGAIQGLQEMTRAGDQLATSDPLALTSPDTVRAPISTTPEQQEDINWYNKATSTVLEETVKPAAMTAATLGSSVGCALYLPFMVEDFVKVAKTEGTGEAVKQFAKSAVGGDAIEMATDPKYDEYAKEHPGRYLAQIVGSALAPIQTISAPLSKKFKKDILDEYKGKPKDASLPEFKVEEPVVVEKPKVTSEETKAAFVEPKETVTVKPEEILKSTTDTISDIYKEKIDKETSAQSIIEDLVGVKGSGRDIPVAESTYPHPVTQLQLKKAVNEFTAYRVGRGKSRTKGSLGYFETDTEGIRTNNHGEYGVTAHEVGHYLDKELKLQGADGELIQNAKDVFGDAYKPKQLRGEGIAEFTREYILNPEEARKNFPQYTQLFEEGINKRPDLKNKLDNLSQLTRKWYTQSAEARGRGSIVFDADIPKTSLTDKGKGIGADLYTEWVDKYNPLDNIVKQAEKDLGYKLLNNDNPYIRAQAVENVSRARTEMLLKGDAADIQALRAYYKGGAIPHDVSLYDVAKSLDNDALTKAYPDYLKNSGSKNWYEALGTYLTASRTLEVHRAQVKKNIEKLKAELKELEGKAKEAVNNGDSETLSKIFKETQNKQKQLANVDKSHETPIEIKDAEAITKNTPIELITAATVWDDFNANFLSLAERFGLLKAGSTEKLRAESANYSPLHRSFYEETGKTAQGQHVSQDMINLQTLYRSLTEEGSTRLVTDPVATMATMVRRMVSLGERNEVAKKVVDISKQEGMSSLAMRVSGTAAESAKNIFYVWENGKKVAYQAICPELVDALKGDPIVAKNVVETGLSLASSALRYTATSTPPFWVFNALRDTVTAAALNPNHKVFIPFFDTLKGVYTLWRDPDTVRQFKMAGVRHTTLAAENAKIAHDLAKQTGVKTWKEATPAAIALKVFELGNKIGQTFEEGTRIAIFKQALSEGKDLTTAGLYASETTTNFSRSGKSGQRVNRVVPFLNASIQGTDKYLRAFKNDPIKTGIQTAFWVTTPSILLWNMNHDEDWYRKTPVDIKNRFWLFKVGDVVYRYPKPEGIGFLFGSLPERTLEYMKDNNVDAKPSFKMAGSNLAPNMWLQAFKPIVEVMFNKNSFTGRPIETQFDLTLPPEQRYDVYTSEFAKAVGKAMGVSPKVFDHIGRGYFSNYYTAFADITDLMIGTEKARPSKKWNEKIFLNRFIHDPEKTTAYVDEFYKGLDELKQQKNGKFKTKQNESALKGMNSVNTQLTKLNKLNKTIRERKDLGGDEKRRLMDVNKKKADELCRKAVVKYLGKRYYKLEKDRS